MEDYEKMSTDTTVKVLDPTVSSTSEKSTIANRPESLEGYTVGLLSNGKKNSEELLRSVYDILSKEHKLKKAVEYNKGNASRPCPPDILNNLAKECDIVITASGD
jgi:hypothetical protein|tara:strand:- start:616 stop:930 length:315 start_codon:yes stop_codon:yes gene_type:complete